MGINYGRKTYGKIELLQVSKQSNDVEVGNFCSIAQDVYAIVSGHNPNWVSTYPFSYKGFEKAKDITGHPRHYKLIIGNDVWIGRHSMFVGNVNVGDGAIIGGGTVVRGNIEPYSIVIGNPSQFVKKRFSDEQIEKLLKIKWWNWSDKKINNNVHLLYSDRIDEFINMHIGKINK